MNSPAVKALYVFFGKRFREKRAAALKKEFANCQSVLDVGGGVGWWLSTNWRPSRLVLLNNEPFQGRAVPGAEHLEADALDMPLPDQSFDLAMSNSVIEHVSDQAKFAAELMRTGKRIYCQTPSKWFPVEPHCLGLFVHWLPRRCFTYFVYRYLTLYGWIGKPDRAQFEEFQKEVHLLGKSELAQLFPGCTIRTERFCGLPKSYVVTSGHSQSVAEENSPWTVYDYLISGVILGLAVGAAYCFFAVVFG
jgi:hypothetical protein